MSSFGMVPLKEIFSMLKKCAPGHTVEKHKHYFWVSYKGAVYRSLPTGKHGKRKGRADIEVGHVRKMIRHLEIDLKCAKKHLPILR